MTSKPYNFCIHRILLSFCLLDLVYPIEIISTDKFLFQLKNENIKQFQLNDGTYCYTEAWCRSGTPFPYSVPPTFLVPSVPLVSPVPLIRPGPPVPPVPQNYQKL